MDDFPTIRVGDLLSEDRGISVGVMYPGGDTPGGVPLIRAGDIQDGAINPNPSYRISAEVHHKYRRTALEGGECLITLVGKPGQTVVVPNRMAGWNAARALAVVRLKEPENTDYFALAMSSPTVQETILNWCNTTVQPTLNLKEIKELPIPWPDKQTRDHIAGTIGILNTKIELNRRMNETLEAMARAIFKDWFVDFGPTRAKAEGRPPYLAPDLWSLFPDALDDENKPVGWETFTLADLAQLHRATVSPAAEPEQTFEHYSIPAYDSGNEPVLDWGGSIKSNKTVVPDGAVLLSKLNPEIERVWLPNPKGGFPQVASTEFLAFTPLADASRAVLYCMFKSEAFRAEMAAMVTGTSKSHQRVSPKALLTREVLAADPQLLAAFDDMVRPFLDRLLANRRGSRTLAQTRDLLLPKLMSGEIRLVEADKAVEAVA